MSKNDDILKLQNELISSIGRSNMSGIFDDFWKAPKAEPQAKEEIKEEKAAEKAEKNPKEDINELLKELETYIGLESVKDEVNDLINLVKVNKLRKEHGLKTPDLSLHMVFMGNPGTGKTMMARFMARVYHSLDVLSKGQLVEVDRSGLVAGFVGQTAIKTSEVIEKALGGVLFIDEAYALSPENAENDYGREAIETILKAMEDNRDDLVVIVAGYNELMDDFINSNPGLRSRFNRYMYFEDYTAKEMLEIFKMRCEQSSYKLENEEAEDALIKAINEKRKDENFGNARGVRNLFEKIIITQSNRLASESEITKEILMSIKACDIINTLNDE